MVYNLDDKNKNGFSREAHSKDFRRFIENEIYYKNNTLLASAIKDNEIEPIIDVVLGHSNIKNVTPEINTLKLVPEHHIGTGANLKIRTGILTAFLRLADEIDINSRRIDGLEYKEGQIGENSIKSLPHWRKCEIFDIPMVSPDNSSILLRPISKKILPKEYFTPRLNELGDVINEYNVSEAMLTNEELKNDIKFVIELCDKVNAEIEAIKKTIDLHKYIVDYKIESARIDNNDIAIAMIEYRKIFSEIGSHVSPVSKKKASLKTWNMLIF